jgi:hypothetical protein
VGIVRYIPEASTLIALAAHGLTSAELGPGGEEAVPPGGWLVGTRRPKPAPTTISDWQRGKEKAMPRPGRGF